jgi:hypothetical protein
MLFPNIGEFSAKIKKNARINGLEEFLKLFFSGINGVVRFVFQSFNEITLPVYGRRRKPNA